MLKTLVRAVACSEWKNGAQINLGSSNKGRKDASRLKLQVNNNQEILAKTLVDASGGSP